MERDGGDDTVKLGSTAPFSKKRGAHERDIDDQLRHQKNLYGGSEVIRITFGQASEVSAWPHPAPAGAGPKTQQLPTARISPKHHPTRGGGLFTVSSATASH